jgi:ribosomally synthesized peptide (two-chain TOMM family)
MTVNPINDKVEVAVNGGSAAATAAQLGVRPSNALDALTDFRTTWLRAIAQAWVDVGYKERLLDDPKAALKELGFQWPWEGNLQFKVKEKTDFIWVADNWVWPDNETEQEGLTLYVPLVPPDELEDHAAALADYYRQRPGLLVSNTSGAVSGDLNLNAFKFNEHIASAFANNRISGIGNVALGNLAPPAGGLVPGEVDFLDFGVVLTSIMAKAWENRRLRELIGNPYNFRIFTSTVRGYTPPWALNLSVKQDPGRNGNGVKWNKTAMRWDNLSPYHLTLHLPQRPDQPREESLALASYNATGAEFFATCCV